MTLTLQALKNDYLLVPLLLILYHQLTAELMYIRNL